MKKNSNSKKKQTKKLNVGAILSLVFIVACIITFYCFFKLEGAIIITLGIALILFIAKLFDMTKKDRKKRKILKTFVIIFLILAILVTIGIGAFMAYVVYSAPEFDPALLKEKQSSIIYDNQGQEIKKMGSQIRENIEFENLPEIFIDALIATEDSRFYQHRGIDIARFSKAVIGQLFGKSDAGGGSTISMQVIKNSFTDTTSTGIKGLIRKFTDIYLAVFKLEKQYTKEQIIEFYVNNHNLGDAWGVEEASKFYFGKSAKDMNLSEAALLAGMYQAPGTYNPRKYPEKAEARRKTVLNLMVRHKYITKEEADLANSIPVSSLLNYQSYNQSPYQGYIDTLLDEIKDKYGLDPNTTSMLIYSNMNRTKQDAINNVANGTSYHWIDDYVQAGVVVLEAQTGKVEALIAARNYNGEKLYNYTTDINRQIGSTAKPLFDYAPGMEYNNWSTYTLFDDSPYTYSNGKSIKDYDGDYKGVITLRYALADSRNIPALKAFQQVDKKKIIELVTSVGITPEISGNTIHEAHAIGAFNGSNPMQMAGAYQIFANGGKYTEPYLASKIILRSTGEVIENKNETKQVISDSTAYMIADILKGNAQSNGNWRMRSYKYQVTDNFGVKTGTTNYDSNMWKTHPGLASDAISDCWVMGFTPETVISLWYGYKELDKDHLERVLHWVPATNERANLFNALANAAFNHNGADFVMPSSVVKVGVEAGTNPPLLPSQFTPSGNIIYELFKVGTEPTETSNRYARLSAPDGLNLTYKGGKIELTWNKVSDPGYVEGGVFGYYVYYTGTDGEKKYFTTKNSYTFDDLSTYIGTYSVRAGYKDTDASLSEATSRSFNNVNTYELVFTGKSSSTFNVGDTIDTKLFDGSLVVLKENGTVVNKDISKNLSIVVKNSSGDTVTSISSESPETYTVTYTIKYDDYNGKVSNKIIIK